MGLQNCGGCRHSRIFPQDMSKRICRGAPPQIVVLPAHNGVSVQHCWPTVEAGDEGCSLYKMRIDIDSSGVSS